MIVSHGCTIGTFGSLRTGYDAIDQKSAWNSELRHCGFEYESETENFVLENLVDPLRWGHKDDDVVKL